MNTCLYWQLNYGFSLFYPQCLDDSRNWYKLRNSKGEVGHAPYTIIQAVRK